VLTFSGFLQEILMCTGVQISQTEVCIATKFKKFGKKQEPKLPSPNPRGLVDSDLQNASGALD